MKLNTIDFLYNNPSIYVKLAPSFFKEIKISILKKYKTLKGFNNETIKINYCTLKYEFRKAKYHPLLRILEMAKSVGINKEEIFNNINGFRISGSHSKKAVILPNKVEINKNFVEGYALYIAEGDTGLNGRTRSRKLRFTNSELNVIKFFIQWLNNHFSTIDFYLSVILPLQEIKQNNLINHLAKELSLSIKQIKLSRGYYNKQIKYRVCCDNAILIDLVLSLEKTIKKLCLNDKKLAAAYTRGMMIGEGTAYFNRSRYVRIEMKNEREIKYLTDLFALLNYKYKLALRSNRENMWSIYIGAKELKKFYNEIGFGIHQKRQKILERAVNKKLRVNQYC